MLPSRAPHHLHPLPMPPTFPRGHPSTAFPPELGAAGVGGGGGCGRGASFPHVPAEWGRIWGGSGLLLVRVSPPFPTPEVRTGFQAQVQAAVATAGLGGGDTRDPRAAPHPRTRHTPHVQTDSDTDGAGGEPCAPLGKVEASRSGRGGGVRFLVTVL